MTSAIQPPPTIPREEFSERQARARDAAAARGFDGLVVWSLGGSNSELYGDLSYLANYHSPWSLLVPSNPVVRGMGQAALILPVDGDPVLIADDLGLPGTSAAVRDAREEPDLYRGVAAAVRELGLCTKRLALCGDQAMPVRGFRELQLLLGEQMPSLQRADSVVEELRFVKSDHEIAALRHAAAVGTEWMRATLEAVQEGVTEGDIMGEALKFGARRHARVHEIVLAGGPNPNHYFGGAGNPHWNCDRYLQKGDLVHVDIAAPVGNYYTDFARSTVVGGAVTAQQKEVLDASVALIEAILAMISPGIEIAELHRCGCSWLERNGFGDLAGPGAMFGHSLGLGCEAPWIFADEHAVLEPGVVLAVECQIGRPSVGMALFEQDVVVTQDGFENLTESCPSRWWT